jgi:exopolyphosphatase / guanosine-5'-triphosphate,3'-diphosphate pyrophosphatase
VRIAVVDVGTNTTRLYVATVKDGSVAQETTRISRVTRLGAGVDASGRLAADAIEREYAVLEDYRRTVEAIGTDRAVAVMTSAVRDADNGPEFARDVEERFGFDARIISGDEEARLTYLGATDEITDCAAEGQTLVFDIGGGSTEIVIGHGHTLDFHVSTQAGVVRQADRHITTDPPSPEQLTALRDDLHEILDAAVPLKRRTGIARALGVAGTPTSLAAIAQQLEPYDPSRVHGYELTVSKRDEIFQRLLAMPLDQRQLVAGLHPDRAIAILPGIVILTSIMELFGLERIEVSEHDILRGAAIFYSAAAAAP